MVSASDLDHKVPGLNPAEGRKQLKTVWHFIAQILYHPSVLSI